MKLIALIAGTLILAGCASPGVYTPPVRTASDITGMTTAEQDRFQKVTRYVGPDVTPGLSSTLFLRGWADFGSTADRFQIYAIDQYRGRGWKFLEAAFDEDGQELRTTIIERKVLSCRGYGGCLYSEHIGINVDRAYLDRVAARSGGLQVKITGRGGSTYVYLPSDYTRGFLAKVDQ